MPGRLLLHDFLELRHVALKPLVSGHCLKPFLQDLHRFFVLTAVRKFRLLIVHIHGIVVQGLLVVMLDFLALGQILQGFFGKHGTFKESRFL